MCPQLVSGWLRLGVGGRVGVARWRRVVRLRGVAAFSSWLGAVSCVLAWVSCGGSLAEPVPAEHGGDYGDDPAEHDRDAGHWRASIGWRWRAASISSFGAGGFVSRQRALTFPLIAASSCAQASAGVRRGSSMNESNNSDGHPSCIHTSSMASRGISAIARASLGERGWRRRIRWRRRSPAAGSFQLIWLRFLCLGASSFPGFPFWCLPSRVPGGYAHDDVECSLVDPLKAPGAIRGFFAFSDWRHLTPGAGRAASITSQDARHAGLAASASGLLAGVDRLAGSGRLLS